MDKCSFNDNIMCGSLDFTDDDFCNKCMLSRIVDNTNLLITAIGNLTASIEERLCKEEQK